MKIALLCPTRNRLKDVTRLIASLCDTGDSINYTLYLGIDSDDKDYDALPEKEWIRKVPSGGGTEFIGLGKIWNNMMKHVTEDILMMVGDDMTFETQGWDQEIIKEFEDIPPDKMKLVHCNDGMRGEGNPIPEAPPFAVAPFIHRRYYDVIGIYAREEWKHGYHDTWINDVYTIMDRKKYRHDIMIRHRHIYNPDSNALPDSTSHRLCAGYDSVPNSLAQYNDMYPMRAEEAKRLLCL